ncbi:L,D-transpeptidase [Rhodopseudomonas sp. B29]|uniref:L,D-transpeptidase n=1 Tax=Rhodopseudomonas sp. B29 TaxID=95607 RepID=UPI00034CA5E8|nr:L,D-transpeptidase [Rhodopseudomonas sp. B29]
MSRIRITSRSAAIAAVAIASIGFATTANAAQTLPLLFFPFLPPASDTQPLAYAPTEPAAPQIQATTRDEDDGVAAELPARLKRQIVAYDTREAPGTIVVDTPNTYLYYVLGNGRAMRYGIGVGRDGFTWSGVKSITKKAEWPDWTPPAEMIARQPYLPRHMAGGPGNPLGARAMYIGGTVYRIHGTNAPGTIGTHVSSGCIRLTNEDVTDLYSRVSVGAKVIVLPDNRRAADAGSRRRG